MKNNFFSRPVSNIYSKPSSNSEVVSQILYGEKFKILSKKKDWIKIKTNYDNYIGYIKNQKFYQKFKASHKIYKLKSKIFKKKNRKFIPTNSFLHFASALSIKNQNKKYIEFEKNKWIRSNDIKKFIIMKKIFLKF